MRRMSGFSIRLYVWADERVKERGQDWNPEPMIHVIVPATLTGVTLLRFPARSSYSPSDSERVNLYVPKSSQLPPQTIIWSNSERSAFHSKGNSCSFAVE